MGIGEWGRERTSGVSGGNRGSDGVWMIIHTVMTARYETGRSNKVPASAFTQLIDTDSLA